MTELLSRVEAPSDAELISRVRGGDVSAYGELFSRHVEAARRLGRQLVRGTDADDLVSDAFAKTLQVLQSGGGPDVAFRAYLLTSVRRLHVDRLRAAKRVQPSEDMTVYDDGVPFQDTAVASFENGAAAKAFSSLPERWQLVLWHLEVEGQKPADIAPLLGMSANSVSALAYRAREGLRQAFLTMHLADSPTEECRWVNEHLGAYVRKGLSRRDTAKVQEHLDGCRRCTAMYLELNEVNSNLAGIIAPIFLGAAAAGYVSSAGGAGLSGVSALVGRLRDAVGVHAGGGSSSTGGAATGGGATTGGAATGGAATAGGAVSTGAVTGGAITGTAITTGGMITAGSVVAAGVAAVTTAAFVFGGGSKEIVSQADRPTGLVQAPSGANAPAASGQAAKNHAFNPDVPAGGPNPFSAGSWIVGRGGRPNTAGSGTSGTDGGPRWGAPWLGGAPAAGGGSSTPGSDSAGPGAGTGPGNAGNAPGGGTNTGTGGSGGTGNSGGTDTGGNSGGSGGTDTGGNSGGSGGTDTGGNSGGSGGTGGSGSTGNSGGTDTGGNPGGSGGTDTGGNSGGSGGNSGSGNGNGDSSGGGNGQTAGAALSVTAGDVVNGALTLSLKGDNVPSTVELSLGADAAGISFHQETSVPQGGASATPVCDWISGTTVRCPVTKTPPTPFSAGSEFLSGGTVTTRLDVPSDDATFTVTVRSLDGKIAAEPFPVSYHAPFRLVTPTGGGQTLVTPVSGEGAGPHLYKLSLRFTGVKNGDPVRLELTRPSDAFEPTTGCTIYNDPTSHAQQPNWPAGPVADCTLDAGGSVDLVVRLPGALTSSGLVASYNGTRLDAVQLDGSDTKDTGSGNTSSGNTSSGNTGSANTGSGNTGSGNTGTGNTSPGSTSPGNTSPGSSGPGSSVKDLLLAAIAAAARS